jgi:2-keto-4-pentenoate hydratase
MSSCDIAAAADLLVSALQPGGRIAALPDGARPADWDEAYAIQDAVIHQLGTPAGWKVGAAAPDAEPFRGALTAATITGSPAELPAGQFNVIGVEAELVYRFGRALPARDRPYGRDEVLAAIASVHAAIEIVDTRYKAWNSVDRLSQVADRMNHGALIVGGGRTDWDAIKPLAQPVVMVIDGTPAVAAIGGNSAGEPLRMLEWLANKGARSLGGIRAGDVVTTGSCTGTVFIEAGQHAVAEFAGLGSAEVRIV